MPDKDYPNYRESSRFKPLSRAYTLSAADIGAKPLPMASSALRISVGSNVDLPLTMRIVAASEPDDNATTDLVISTAGDRWEPISVRRIVSINGAAEVPAGVSIILGWG